MKALVFTYLNFAMKPSWNKLPMVHAHKVLPWFTLPLLCSVDLTVCLSNLTTKYERNINCWRSLNLKELSVLGYKANSPIFTAVFIRNGRNVLKDISSHTNVYWVFGCHWRAWKYVKHVFKKHKIKSVRSLTFRYTQCHIVTQ